MPAKSMIALLAAAVFVAAYYLTSVFRSFAARTGLIDYPNSRSSHATPTPRGGGIGFVVAFTLGIAALLVAHGITFKLACALTSGGTLIAWVGYKDDRVGLSVVVRLLAQLVSAAFAVLLLAPAADAQVESSVSSELWHYGLQLLIIVASINVFNFMDGIDGIAASEAIFVAWSGALLATNATASVAMPAVVLGAACLGFLRWNWPPARIFMGDVGSAYLGYVIAVIALAAARADPVAPWVWLILSGVFFADAGVTLVVRLARRERVYKAHRSHAYQWLSRRWRSHGRVTIAVLLVDVLWLLPCAAFATLRPSLAAVTTLLALAPLVLVVTVAGAGRPEQPHRATS